MKMSDLSYSQQKNTVEIKNSNGIFAIIPPSIEKNINLTQFIGLIEKSSFAVGLYTAEVRNPLVNDFIVDLLICREAAIAAQVNMVNVSMSDVLVEVYASRGKRELPGNLRLAMNFHKALKFGLALAKTEKNQAFTLETFKQIHAICAEGLIDMGAENQFRSEQTWVRGHRIENARLVPPPPAYIDKCMGELATFLCTSSTSEDFLPLVIRTGLMAAQLKAIQPFTITATDLLMRVIIPMIGVANDLPPVFMSNFLHSNNTSYFEYQAEQQLSGDWTNWLKFFLNGYIESTQEACVIIHSIKHLKVFFEESLLTTRSDSAMRKVLETMLKCPAFTIQLLQKNLGMSFQTPNAAVADLVQRKLVHSVLEVRRNRIFVTSGVVDILQGGHGLPSL